MKKEKAHRLQRLQLCNAFMVEHTVRYITFGDNPEYETREIRELLDESGILQAADIRHNPNWKEFYERDVENIRRYFAE
jgi:hypothetical protein